MSQRVGFGFAGVLAVLGVIGTMAAPVHAATITVNSPLDIISPDDRQCTLREAVIAANTNVASGPGANECPPGDSGSDLIVFLDLPGSPDEYALGIPPTPLNDARSGDLNITEDLVIIGNLHTETIISGGVDRVFRVGPGLSVQIQRLQIRFGNAFSGAGIKNEGGMLRLTRSVVRLNSGTCIFAGCSVEGAGLWNSGTVTIDASIVESNRVTCLTNACTAFGGGIFNDNQGALFVESSSIASNEVSCFGEACVAEGGGIHNRASAFVANSVVEQNRARCDAEHLQFCDARGGGLFNAQGIVDMRAVIRDNLAECQSSLFGQTGCNAEGGGLANHLGVMTASETSVVGNRARTLCPQPPCGAGGGGHPRGGGIHNTGRIDLAGSRVSGNLAGCGKGECHPRGGGLFSDTFFESHAVVVSDSTFSGNSVVSQGGAQGGGIYNVGRLEVERSTVALNFAFGRGEVLGGGIVSGKEFIGGDREQQGDARIVNTTVSGNFTTCVGQICGAFVQGGGGLYLLAFGSNDVAFSTLVDNYAVCAGSCPPLGGGILAHVDATLRIKEAIVANSTANGVFINCSQTGGSGAPFAALGVNLATDGTCPGFTLPGTNPLLGPLNVNGGPTETHALLAGSPAIDAASDCLGIDGATVQVDQRNTSRPKGPACDLGAYERFRLLGGGGSTPVPPGFPRDRRAASDRAMCRMLRAFDRGLRVHERSGVLAPEDADAIREVSARLRAGVDCPVRGLRLDTLEDPA
jgi:CSLREA domain-containing protein